MGKTIKAAPTKMGKIEAKKKKLLAKKEKIGKGKGGACTPVIIAALMLAGVFAGCASADPRSRAASAHYRDIVLEIGNSRNLTATITMGDGAFQTADSAGSTETQTATPTNTTDIRPQTDVNTTGGRTAGVLESIVGAFGTWLNTPDGKAACSTGNCTTGGDCSDGACNP